MRLIVNLATGETLTIQLPNELGEWQRRASDPSFQGQIRGVGIIRGGEYITLPVPKLFAKMTWDLEQVVDSHNVLQSASVVCWADDLMIKATTYNQSTPAMTRLDVRRMGKRRWKPQEKHG